MKHLNRIQILLVISILILGLILRLHNYSVYPQRGASSDEYTYSFLGVSLIKEHVPISWSYFSAYKHKYDLTIKNLYFPIVYPYFDHPPLNGLVVGAWSILFGQDTFHEIDLKTIRLVPIFLSIISSILVFLLGLRLYDFKTGIWALLIYTTTTIFVMNGRVVFAENLLTPLFLVSLYLFILFGKNLNQKKVITLGILSGLALWTKEVGVAVFLTMLYLFITEKIKPKIVFTLIFTFSLFVIGYILYGAYYDWDVFREIVAVQATRNIGPQTLLLLTSTPIIVNKVFYDGWYFFGFLSIFFSFFDFRKHKMLVVSAAAYFMLLIFSLNREGEMGWYMIPLFPFMALLSARLLVESLRKQSWFIFVFLLFVGMFHVRYLYEVPFGLTPFAFRMLMLVIFAPSVFALLMSNDKLFKILGNAWFYIFILLNIFLTYNYVHPA